MFRTKDPKPKSVPSSFLKDLWLAARADNLVLFAAAIAFFAFVALVPTLVATVSITSLVADPVDLITETESALEAAPVETRDFLVGQLDTIVNSDSGDVGLAVGVSIALALFSASGAIGQLMAALNVVFGRSENRNFVLKRLLAIGLLFGSIVLVGAMLFAMAVLPELLSDWSGSSGVRSLVDVARFVGLGLLLVISLTTLYRVGPASASTGSIELLPGGRRELVSIGALVGAALFVLLSWGFGVFVSNFGSYNETYGTLAGIIVVLLWLQLVSLAVLIGAEIDSVRRQRRIDRARTAIGLAPKP